jgi:hypothetical protein
VVLWAVELGVVVVDAAVVLELVAGAAAELAALVWAAWVAPAPAPPPLPPHALRTSPAATASPSNEIRIPMVFALGAAGSCPAATSRCVTAWQYQAVSQQFRHELDHDAIRDEHAVQEEVARHDPFWAPQLLIAAAILLDLSLAEKVTLGPTWLLPGVEAVALIGLMAVSPHPRLRHSKLRRRFTMSTIALVSATNTASLILLCHWLLHGGGGTNDGRALIGSGIVLWVTNVLLFSVWFWLLDRGGPVTRATDPTALPDFLFVQMTDRKFAPPDWHPTIIDYLYTSFTNATAFSPTDTMPLTAMAKSLMTVQSLTALVTIGLVVARAVNILS